MPTSFAPLPLVDLLFAATQPAAVPLYGREREVRRLVTTLHTQPHTNVLVHGPRGSGLTSFIHATAHHVTTDAFPGVATMPFLLLSGHVLAQRLRRATEPRAYVSYVAEACASLEEFVLVIDNAELVLQELPDVSALPELLGPFRQPARRLVLVFSDESWDSLKQEYELSLAEFQQIALSEPDDALLNTIVRDRARERAVRSRVQFEKGAVERIISYGKQLAPDRALPGRVVHFLDDVCAAATIQNTRLITADFIHECFNEQTHGPDRRNADTTATLHSLPATLTQAVIGQDAAVTSIAETLQRGQLGLTDPHRPIGSFMLLGPSGVGKTEIARVIAREIYGSESSLIRIDMSEYQERHAVQRLLGAPPGYVGYEAGGQLTTPVRDRPYSLILLDEIEKADPAVFDIFLQVLDDGRLTDGQGTTVDFSKTVIIATSNIGVELLIADWQAGVDVSSPAWVQKKMLPQLQQHFRLEFLNRFSALHVFSPLSTESLIKIARLELRKLERRFAHKNVQLALDDAALARLVAAHSEPRFGARPLRRALEQAVEQELAQQLLTTKAV